MTQLATVANTSTAVIRVQFIARRAIAFGIDYKAEDGHITTVNGKESSCSCGMEKYSVICIHRLAAHALEKAYAEEAQKRNAYCAEFAIY